MGKRLNVLVLDIETAPMLAYIWDMRDIKSVGQDQIVHDRYVISHGTMWWGQPDTFEYHDQFGEGPENDARILRILKKRLNKADVVITQNGQWFDSRRVNARMGILGIKPPSPYKHYDTYQLVKRVFDLPENKLSYITKKFNKKYRKTEHKEFPGFSLWKEYLKDNKKARASMRKYNEFDVRSTDEAATNLMAWAPEHFPDFFEVSDRSMECGRCGYEGQMQEVKAKRNKNTKYRQYRCPGCGGFQTGARITNGQRKRK